MSSGDGLLSAPPRTQRGLRKDDARKLPTSLRGKGFMGRGYSFASGTDSVASGLTMGTISTRASSSTAASMAAAKAARKKSLAQRSHANQYLTEKALERRRKKMDRIAVGAGAKNMLETASNNPIMGGGTFDTLTSKPSPSDEGEHHSRILQTTPSTASLSSNEDVDDDRSNGSSVEVDRYATSCAYLESSSPNDSNAPSGYGDLSSQSEKQEQTDPDKSTSSPLRPRSLGTTFDIEDPVMGARETTEWMKIVNAEADDDWDFSTEQAQGRNSPADDLSVSNSSGAATAITSNFDAVEDLRCSNHGGDAPNKPNDMLSGTNGSDIFSMSEAHHDNDASAIISPLGPNGMAAVDSGDSSSYGSAPEDDPVLSTREIPSISTVSEIPITLVPESKEEGVASHQSNIAKPLVDAETEHMLDAMRNRMHEPNQQMANLLTTIHRPLEGSGVTMNRGYMTRRKNACGALKVMASKNSSRKNICWTQGVLTSLTTVLDDSGDGNLEEEYPDTLTRLAFVEARKRAVATLLYLSTSVENRVIIFHSPGLISALTKVIRADDGECRQGCCAIIAYLAKTSEIRLLMGKVEDIIDAATLIITPKAGADAEEDHVEDLSISNSSSMGPSASFEDEIYSIEEGCTTNKGGLSGRKEKPRRGTTKRGKKSRGHEQIATVEKKSSSTVDDYDRDPNQFLHGSRASIFAALVHLSKEKENTSVLARNMPLISVLISISDKHKSPSHVRAITILANLTRNKDNATSLVFHVHSFLPMIVRAMKSGDGDCRRHALYALWNLSYDVTCRHEIADVPDLLVGVCECAINGDSNEEQLAASGALRNLSDEPSNLIPMTNSRQCVATLMQLTNIKGGKLDMVQYNACDALATLSHWLRKISTGASTIGTRRDSGTLLDQNGLYCPKHMVATYDQFE